MHAMKTVIAAIRDVWTSCCVMTKQAYTQQTQDSSSIPQIHEVCVRLFLLIVCCATLSSLICRNYLTCKHRQSGLCQSKYVRGSSMLQVMAPTYVLNHKRPSLDSVQRHKPPALDAHVLQPAGHAFGVRTEMHGILG